MLAQVSITLGYQSNLNGRALALTTVTFAGNVTVVKAISTWTVSHLDCTNDEDLNSFF
jgi:hypothetical protein